MLAERPTGQSVLQSPPFLACPGTDFPGKYESEQAMSSYYMIMGGFVRSMRV